MRHKLLFLTYLLLTPFIAFALKITATFSISYGTYSDTIYPILFKNNIPITYGTPISIDLTSDKSEQINFNCEFDCVIQNGNYTLCFISSEGEIIGGGVNVVVSDFNNKIDYTADTDIITFPQKSNTQLSIENNILKVVSSEMIHYVNIYNVSGYCLLSQNVKSNVGLIELNLSSSQYIVQVVFNNTFISRIIHLYK